MKRLMGGCQRSEKEDRTDGKISETKLSGSRDMEQGGRKCKMEGTVIKRLVEEIGWMERTVGETGWTERWTR